VTDAVIIWMGLNGMILYPLVYAKFPKQIDSFKELFEEKLDHLLAKVSHFQKSE
jgi:hypothetical protein